MANGNPWSSCLHRNLNIANQISLNNNFSAGRAGYGQIQADMTDGTVQQIFALNWSGQVCH